jgi:hypothetical protein
VPFSYRKLIISSLREFSNRYIFAKGYTEGVRGFALSVMMAFYRALSHIKLWEKYQFESEPVSKRYDNIRDTLLAVWKSTKP